MVATGLLLFVPMMVRIEVAADKAVNERGRVF